MILRTKQTSIPDRILTLLLTVECFSQKLVPSLFSKYNELTVCKFQMANEKERKKSHYSISVVAIGILLSQHSSSVLLKLRKRFN